MIFGFVSLFSGFRLRKSCSSIFHAAVFLSWLPNEAELEKLCCWRPLAFDPMVCFQQISVKFVGSSGLQRQISASTRELHSACKGSLLCCPCCPDHQCLLVSDAWHRNTPAHAVWHPALLRTGGNELRLLGRGKNLYTALGFQRVLLINEAKSQLLPC